ncbi:MAG: DUF4384 domain-containing protein [Pirellulaceae bacterium]
MQRLLEGCSLLLACFIFTPAFGQQAARQNGGAADAIRNDQSSFLVRCELNHKTGSYREGDALSATVACEVDAYIYVLYQQADGKVVQIFPNRLQPNNKVSARQTVRIPARNDLFHWTIGPPFGKETLKVIASKRPLDELSNPEARKKLFPPVDGQAMKGIDLVLGERPPSEWEEDAVELYTYSKDAAPLEAHQRRVGVFFGVAHYEFNAEYEQAQLDAGVPADKVRALNLPSSHNNAKVLAGLLKEVGQLDEVRVFTNEQATRDKMHEMLTHWLPQHTRPGDTVIFFYSGHGIQIGDDTGDEPDHYDEVLNPYDQITGDVLVQLAKKRDQLDASQAARLETLRQLFVTVYQKTESGAQANEAVIRATGVSDDEFGQWLQHLDGRRIAIVFNGCHTGGFANNEKGVEGEGKSGGFDFLDGEISRLKDIGQRHCSLLTACTASQSSLVHRDREFSVLPYFLIEMLNKRDQGPINMTDAHSYCTRRMEDYFREMEARTSGRVPAHQPQLYTDRDEPIYLKP